MTITMLQNAEAVEMSVVELLQRKDEILSEHNMTLDDFRERANSYALVGSQWEAWNDLKAIAFLLDDN